VEDRGDHDHLIDPADAAEYLVRHHLPVTAQLPTPAQLECLSAIRETVRGLLDPAAPAWPPAALAILESTRFVADQTGAIHSDRTGWDALIEDLMLPFIQLVEMRGRLRACGNSHCRLIFLDLTRNRSRRWCDNAGCGNRDRVRRYRRSATG
jgi:predicted RNA-binding Zn ribbon-like protein